MLAKLKAYIKRQLQKVRAYLQRLTTKLAVKQTLLTIYAFITKRLNNKQVELYLVKNTDTILTDIIVPIN